MSLIWQHFRWSFIIAIIGVVLGYYIGGLNGMFIVALLSIMEISLSFDNAVVNAKVLDKMSEAWQKAFLTVGMFIAVFGMRFAFPIIVVSIATGMGPIESFNLGVNDTAQYGQVLADHKHLINGFGGSFLFMLFIKFILDHEKDVHWLHWIEEKAVKFGKLEGVEVAIALIAVLIVSRYLPEEQQFGFLFASVSGIVTYEVVSMISNVLEDMEDSMIEGNQVKKVAGAAGIGLFMYLEILDASFSFDGVIAAFALSDNFFIITIGLAVGAMFVRSLTIYLVKKGTLSDYIYLEHGAHYAIGILGVLMFLHLFFHIPEMFTALVGVGFIVLSFISSLKHNKLELEKAKKESTSTEEN